MKLGRASSLKTVPQTNQAKEDQKLEFFMTASHQLKSPLAIIQWCLQVLLESEGMANKDRELVQKALTQANSMSHLIADMLNVFRLSSRKNRNSSFVPVSVNKIIDDVLTQYELIAHNQKVHLVRGPIENDLRVLADETYLRQAVVNLVDNAIKYSPDGGKVNIEAKNNPPNLLEILVTDQGIGIGGIELNKIFREFFRGEQAQQITSNGTGLGLVLVKQIIEEFGGKIEVKSELGKGSTFKLILPKV
jgi:two-component system phosphate regulon sensor histidine kinase PhoR